MATILVVEDHDMTRKLLKVRLESAGHRVLEADNGFRGCELLQEHRVDLVLMDYMMKAFNGLEAFEQMQTIKPYVPCVMVTAYSFPALVKRFMQEGGADFYVKPIREDFENRINTILDRHLNS